MGNHLINFYRLAHPQPAYRSLSFQKTDPQARLGASGTQQPLSGPSGIHMVSGLLPEALPAAPQQLFIHPGAFSQAWTKWKKYIFSWERGNYVSYLLRMVKLVGIQLVNRVYLDFRWEHCQSRVPGVLITPHKKVPDQLSLDNCAEGEFQLLMIP